MKTIGLLGGMSWESTLIYYREINRQVSQSLGGLHSAEILIYSIDFDPLAQLQREGRWDQAANLLVEAALKLQNAGADFLLLCTNTMHKVATQIEDAIQIPLLHIADTTAQTLVNHKIQSVGLLGTAFTMEQSFYKERLSRHFDLQVLIPNDADRQRVHNIIFQELCTGKINSKSKAEFLRIIESIMNQGAEGIILGCTEIGLLLNQKDTIIPLFDTALIHAKKAAEFALQT